MIHGRNHSEDSAGKDMKTNNSDISNSVQDDNSEIELFEFETASVTPENVNEYYSNVDYDNFDEMHSAINNYIHSQPQSKPVTFKWKYKNGVSVKETKLLLSENSDMSSACEFPVTDGAMQASVSNLYSDRDYYYQIVSVKSDGSEINSKISAFKTEPGRRIISIEGLVNARDIGGIEIEGGRTIKQGLVYRTAEFDTDNYKITDKGLAELNDRLAIKTELDLRKPEQRGISSTTNKSFLGDDVRYYNYVCAEYDDFLRNRHGDEGDILRVFADVDNYPILFHCVYGADRTGTVAFLLEGLCGADLDQLIKDYELTAWRNRTYDPFRALVKYSEKAFKGEKLSDKIYTFMKEQCGLTEMEISNIRNILTTDTAVFSSDSIGKPIIR